jgi:hypothetical protein
VKERTFEARVVWLYFQSAVAGFSSLPELIEEKGYVLKKYRRRALV